MYAVGLVLVLVLPCILFDRSIGAHSVCVFGSGWVGRRTLSAEELARDVELLAADNNNLLTVQKLLGDSGGQSSEKMSFSIDHDLIRPSVAVLSSPIHHLGFYAIPPSVYPPGRAAARKNKSGSGMRTTGSKVDIAAVLGLVCAVA